MDIVGFAPGLRAALDGVGRETRSEGVCRDIPSPDLMQRDPKVAEFEEALGRYEHVARRGVSMPGAALMHPGDGPQQSDNFAPRPRLRPGFWIPREVAAKIALF